MVHHPSFLYHFLNALYDLDADKAVSSFDMGRYWASVKICIRNGYTISDGSVWCDTIDIIRPSSTISSTLSMTLMQIRLSENTSPKKMPLAFR